MTRSDFFAVYEESYIVFNFIIGRHVTSVAKVPSLD